MSPTPRSHRRLSWQLVGWAPLVAYSALIFHVSSRQVEAPLGTIRGGDKLLHLAAYAGWGLLAGWAIAVAWPSLRPLPAFVLIFISGTIYGASDEWHQSFVPGRTADVWDLAADAVGAALGALAALALRRVARGRTRQGRG